MPPKKAEQPKGAPNKPEKDVKVLSPDQVVDVAHRLGDTACDVAVQIPRAQMEKLIGQLKDPDAAKREEAADKLGKSCDAQVGSLPQCRSWHHESFSAWRGLCN